MIITVHTPLLLVVRIQNPHLSFSQFLLNSWGSALDTLQVGCFIVEENDDARLDFYPLVESSLLLLQELPIN